MEIEKYSIGMGDRFGCEGAAQLRAVQKAEQRDVVVVPVWNKSFREHSLIGTKPADVRASADRAVAAGRWRHAHYVDADHVGLKTVDGFLGSSNFFTLDVADFIGKSAPDDAIASFVKDMEPLRGELRIPGVEAALEVTDSVLEKFARQYLHAVGEAGRTYRHVASSKGEGTFVTEVSVDEATEPQTPLDLFLLLGAIARERIPLQTVAPKFSGKFLKGIDYVGDLRVFEREFDADVAVVLHAVDAFRLPASLKISVHTGSDKFSLYPLIRRALKRYDAGLHLKTAGTTWLEEVVGIALSGPTGLGVAKHIYSQAIARFDELCKPYATVVEIDRDRLPTESDVESWSSQQFANHLRNDPSCSEYSVHVRQIMHVAFKIAAEMGDDFHKALAASHEATGKLVTDNLFERHIRPLFLEA
jgi:hypothetical protein